MYGNWRENEVYIQQQLIFFSPLANFDADFKQKSLITIEKIQKGKSTESTWKIFFLQVKLRKLFFFFLHR